MLTIDQFVQREVVQCVSSLVSILAATSSYECPRRDAPNASANSAHYDLCIQAQELSFPIADWEEAAREANYTVEEIGGLWGWRHEADAYMEGDCVHLTAEEAWRGCCLDSDIEPYAREVFEHWAVTPWLAERLIAQGEKVDTDFAGMCVWARTTTGQQISADYVIGEIYRDLMAS